MPDKQTDAVWRLGSAGDVDNPQTIIERDGRLYDLGGLLRQEVLDRRTCSRSSKRGIVGFRFSSKRLAT